MFKLETRANGVWSTLKKTFSSYRDAVLCGQDIAPLNFSVITPGGRAPSRAEQLLEPLPVKNPSKRRKAVNDFLASL